MDSSGHLVRNWEWLERPETRTLMAVLDPEGAGNIARFVGGAVRDAFIGRPVVDVDIATVLTPEDVTRRLEAAGVKVVPTGIDHGTVTAVVDGHPFEITTLRRDVETFGRHARVAFTDDWRVDAERRDFTMNALYCDIDGRIYDPVGGIADLLAARVRFIGDAEARIAEDALRILRFFRFHAWYGKDEPCAEGLRACVKRSRDLTRLSAERVREELLKLLGAPDPVPVIRTMMETGILGQVVPEATLVDRLAGLVAVERAVGEADPIRRLGALLPEGSASAGQRLRLTKKEQIRLSEMVVPRDDIKPSGDATPLGRRHRARLYRLGHEGFVDHALLNWAMDGGNPDDRAWAAFVEAARAWTIPEFPLRGRDLVALGMAPGPAVGDLLDALEARWIAHDFKPGKPALLDQAKSWLADDRS
ncbi:MAG: CCA tRNA nucleotidyltransferase [Alphaproteobacteria bacterium]|nr:MAG: CCA tRNA nucleotidyltransferase [Alphaproteobacteria bacterium]